MHANTKRTLPPLFGAVVRPFQQFFHLEAASGIVLLAMAVLAFIWANWPGSTYVTFFQTPLAIHIGDAFVHLSIKEFINDVLMTVFFFVVGLEIKREMALGELRSVSRAILPAIAAIGGMLVPAMVFCIFTWSGSGRAGWGIPMATDIAFTVGCLALLKSRVPHALVVFITALAIFDDIGGILVIAIFYGQGLQFHWLLVALAVVGSGVLLNRFQVQSWIPYSFIGVFLWISLHHSGLHATIAGVILGMLVPARALRPSREVLGELGEHAAKLAISPADEELASAEIEAIDHQLENLQAPLDRFIHALHPVVAYGIMPAFALANAGVVVSGMSLSALTSPVALGVALGLFAGKQIGIFGATLIAVRLKVAPMPGNSSLSKLYGVSIVAGVGFTVALFIAGLAYPGNAVLLDESKIGILIGSALAGIVGLTVLRFTARLDHSAEGQLLHVHSQVLEGGEQTAISPTIQEKRSSNRSGLGRG